MCSHITHGKHVGLHMQASAPPYHTRTSRDRRSCCPSNCPSSCHPCQKLLCPSHCPSAQVGTLGVVRGRLSSSRWADVQLPGPTPHPGKPSPRPARRRGRDACYVSGAAPDYHVETAFAAALELPYPLRCGCTAGHRRHHCYSHHHLIFRYRLERLRYCCYCHFRYWRLHCYCCRFHRHFHCCCCLFPPAAPPPLSLFSASTSAVPRLAMSAAVPA